MDVIRWLMGEEYPEYITAHGDKYVLDHDADIPDTMHVTFRPPDLVLGDQIITSFMSQTENVVN